jgi:hypothetical protein
MNRTTDTVSTLAAAPAESLAHFQQRRGLGWILPDGGCRGIEPQGVTGGLTVKLIHIANIGTETATVELDDYTVEVMYSGVADMLREAARLQKAERAAPCDFSLDRWRSARAGSATASAANRNGVLLTP